MRLTIHNAASAVQLRVRRSDFVAAVKAAYAREKRRLKKSGMRGRLRGGYVAPRLRYPFFLCHAVTRSTFAESEGFVGDARHIVLAFRGTLVRHNGGTGLRQNTRLQNVTV
jgi:hypothetical protein